MFTSSVRLVLIVVVVSLGIYMLTQRNSTGIFLLFAGVLLLVGYFRYGSIWIAFRAYNQGNIEQARKLIGQVRNPQALNAQHQAYYNWIQGGIAASEGKSETAYRLLQAAANGRLRTQNDKSVVEYMLSDLARSMGNIGLARQHLERARSFSHRPQLDSLLADLEYKLNEAT
jgi:uncharacterized protein HemY